MSKVYLSIGSNKGNRYRLINEAVDLIEKKIGKILVQSSFYESKSWGFKSNNFYNICLTVNSVKSPKSILTSINEIETKMGRNKSTAIQPYEYSDRTIDIDILFYDDLVFNSDKLNIPHPKIELRNFVLIPLQEIEPNYIHPVLKKSIENLVLESNDNQFPKILKNLSL